MIQVHLIDDHKLLVEGLCRQINESGIIQVNGISHSLAECRKIIPFHIPDVLLLDINLPDGCGLDFCIEITKKYPSVKLLILSAHDEVSMIRRALSNGIAGYVLKSASSEEVINAIVTVMDGKNYLCNHIRKLLYTPSAPAIWLTTREQELLKLIVEGYTNKEIADKLFLSIETIKTYRKNLILKLGARNAATLVKIAIEQKLI